VTDPYRIAISGLMVLLGWLLIFGGWWATFNRTRSMFARAAFSLMLCIAMVFATIFSTAFVDSALDLWR